MFINDKAKPKQYASKSISQRWINLMEKQLKKLITRMENQVFPIKLRTYTMPKYVIENRINCKIEILVMQMSFKSWEMNYKPNRSETNRTH